MSKTYSQIFIAPILTITDAMNVDALTGGSYLQDRFNEIGPLIGSNAGSYMPIVSNDSFDGVAWYRKQGAQIFATAQELVAAFNSNPKPFNGNILEAEYVSRYGAKITFVNTRTEIGNWTREGIDQLILDLNLIRDNLKSSE